jgi:hypothetical protein
MNAQEARDYAMKQGQRYENIQEQIRIIDRNIFEACKLGEIHCRISLDLLPETMLHFQELGYELQPQFLRVNSFTLHW